MADEIMKVNYWKDTAILFFLTWGVSLVFGFILNLFTSGAGQFASVITAFFYLVVLGITGWIAKGGNMISKMNWLSIISVTVVFIFLSALFSFIPVLNALIRMVSWDFTTVIGFIWFLLLLGLASTIQAKYVKF